MKDYLSQKNEKQIEVLRSAYWDILKGITILFVIIGHQLQYTCNGYRVYLDDPIYKFIYGFHMPMFILISGYFFYFSINKYKAKDIIIKRSRQCLIPILTFTFIVELINGDFEQITIKSLLIEFRTNLWFLWAVFCLSIIVLFIHHLFKDSLWIYFLLIPISFFLPKFFSGNIMYMYPFFVTGYLFNRYCLFKKLFSMNLIPVIIVLGVAYIVLLSFWQRETYIYISGFTVLYGKGCHQALINIQRAITGYCGVFFLLFLIRLTYQSFHDYISNILSYLGNKTLQLYVISTLPFFVLIESNFSTEDVNYLIASIFTVLVTISSLILIELLRKNDFTNFLFFGQEMKLFCKKQIIK